MGKRVADITANTTVWRGGKQKTLAAVLTIERRRMIHYKSNISDRKML
jgi:hypothetical protein